MKRWLTWTLLALASLLILLVLLVLWLGLTRSGLDFALGRTSALLQQKFTWERAEGSLLRGMTLHGVRYADPEIGDYRVAMIAVAPRSRRLLGGGLHLTDVEIRDVDLTLGPPGERPASDEPFRMPELRAPLPIRVDRLQVTGFALHDHQRTPLLLLDRIEGHSAHWTGTRIGIDPLTLAGPDGHLRLQADLDTGRDWAGQAEAGFRWLVPGQASHIGGTLALTGPLDTPISRCSWPSHHRRIPAGPATDGSQAAWQLQLQSDGLTRRPHCRTPLRHLDVDLQADGHADRPPGARLPASCTGASPDGYQC